MTLIELATVTATVAAPAPAMWAVLTDFAHPQRLAPTIDRCSVNGAGVGAVRIVDSSRGLRIHERLLQCDAEALRYQYEVLDSGDMPFADVTRYRATVTLTPVGQSTTVTWRAEGQVDGPLAPVTVYLETLYRRAIDNLAVHALAGSR